MNLSYSEHGSKIAIQIIGSVRESSRSSDDYLMLQVQNRDNMTINETKMLEIDRSSYERHVVNFDFYPEALTKALNLTLTMKTSVKSSIAFQLIVDSNAIEPEIGVISAAIILIFLNILIGTEVMFTMNLITLIFFFKMLYCMFVACIFLFCFVFEF